MHALQISYRMLTDSNLFRLELCALSFFFFLGRVFEYVWRICQARTITIKGEGGSRQLVVWNQFVDWCLSDLTVQAGVRWAC